MGHHEEHNSAPKGIIEVKRPDTGGLRSLYIYEVVGGLLHTLGHSLKNLFFPSRMQTVFYPEEKKELPPTTRGRHRLMKRSDGLPRCTACMLCATNCPADCIHILAGESDDVQIEKYPERFDIDLLRCVVCGFCAEACPLDAIRMDVPEIANTGFTRSDFILTKERLLNHDNREIVESYNPPRPTALTHGSNARP